MTHITVRRSLLVFLPSILLLASAALAAAPAGPLVPRFGSDELPGMARGLRTGDRAHVDAVEVPATDESLALDLERFEVFTPDADIVVHGDGGRVTHLPRPDFVYLKGSVSGEPGSHVFLEVQKDGHTRGFVNRGEDMYLIDNRQEPATADGTPGRLRAERADRALLEASRKSEPWKCAEEGLPEPPHPIAGIDLGAATPPSSAAATGDAPAVGESAAFTHTARVAIETDFEFYSLFNNPATATSYIGNLIGYASSAVYQPEIGTSLAVSSVSLWTTASDPWAQTSTTCGLAEFGKYWNTNKTNVSRTIAHFLSGKGNGGGIAWIGVLCSGPFGSGMASSCPGLGAETGSGWGGGYGYTGNLFGNFNVNNPQVVWDLEAVAHEIGHNFNSPHSHCYGGIGGNSNPIDGCYSGENGSNPTACWGGAQALPGAASLGGGVAGGQNGTIMSYCHLLSGGMGNINFTFGTKAGFNSGVAPAREAQRMSSFVTQIASTNAACLAPVGASPLFASSFEGGPLPGGWSGKN